MKISQPYASTVPQWKTKHFDYSFIDPHPLVIAIQASGTPDDGLLFSSWPGEPFRVSMSTEPPFGEVLPYLLCSYIFLKLLCRRISLSIDSPSCPSNLARLGGTSLFLPPLTHLSSSLLASPWSSPSVSVIHSSRQTCGRSNNSATV